MVVIDTQKLTVKSTWPLPGCNGPSGLAIDSKHHRLFSVCDGKVMAVTDAANGKQVALVPITLPSQTENRSEEHTSELQSPDHLLSRLLLEKKKTISHT